MIDFILMIQFNQFIVFLRRQQFFFLFFQFFSFLHIFASSLRLESSRLKVHMETSLCLENIINNNNNNISFFGSIIAIRNVNLFKWNYIFLSFFYCSISISTYTVIENLPIANIRNKNT